MINRKHPFNRTGFTWVSLIWLFACLSGAAWLVSMGVTPAQDRAPTLRTKAIEDIEVGDYVLAKDPNESGPPTAHKVVALPRNWTEHVVHVQVQGGGELQATREHPFWVVDRGWVPAKDLKAGDQLQREVGSRVVVSSVRIETRTADTFNLIVNGVHTYFAIAGDLPVLVHNGYGSYTNTHQSGMVYVGKGDAARAAQVRRGKSRPLYRSISKDGLGHLFKRSSKFH